MSATAMLPASGRPRVTQAEIRGLVAQHHVDRVRFPVVCVGVRGYYRDTMGELGANDRGVYDDCIALDGPTAFAAFNGNTDPARYRKGRGTGAFKGMASLNPGVYYAHVFGYHKSDPKRPALVQTAGPVRVTRDGDPPYQDGGALGINIHDGGAEDTWSEGCQTIPRGPQYDAFIALVQSEAMRARGGAWRGLVIPYVLVAGPIR